MHGHDNLAEKWYLMMEVTLNSYFNLSQISVTHPLKYHLHVEHFKLSNLHILVWLCGGLYSKQKNWYGVAWKLYLIIGQKEVHIVVLYYTKQVYIEC